MPRKVRVPKKSHNLVLAKTGAYAIAQSAGIHSRSGVKQCAKRENARKACRGKVRDW
jgi:hypothetical protein